MQTDKTGITASQVLFGVAILAFIALVVMEKLKPYRRFTDDIHKASFVTNTTTFLFNNIILTALRATSLYFVAQQFSYLGLLRAMDNHPFKWVITFLLYDFAIYAWHVANHKYEFLWRFHKVTIVTRALTLPPVFGSMFATCFLKSFTNVCLLSLSALMLTWCW
jgi:sterol desaturase/sphingolipid hydroxylase (fatty acid hydroxylase superfamily)